MMFVLRQLQEKRMEQQQELHIIIVNLVKAFDTVNREIMWQILGKIDIPPKIYMMACELQSKWVAIALMSLKSPVVFAKNVYSPHLCLYS